MTEAKLKVIDSHFHMWDPAVQNLPWLDGMKINRKYTFEDLKAEYEHVGVDFLGGVYVEVDCVDHEQEDRLVYDNGDPRILARMLRASLSPTMRVPLNATGIREPLHIDSEPRGRCLEPDFIGGLKALAAHGMPFELCCRGEELGDMAKAFGQVPEVTVIMDHLGNVTSLDSDSREALKAMARLPHSYIKVSGDNPVDPDIVKYVRDVFGPRKVLFSSNWPVVNEHSSFAEHFELMLKIFGEDEDFFMNNALKAYGIEL
ncbi:amidohydrolase family protein [Bifidobacterium sp. ESL0764]|uniref:amidohydrolase family protein n=1 Tax=Bifidobacterium sp. ESL0764 TaxID=2983228 RepID=UPI0023F61D87|nr:amidohydrolase family protein [Bifidobacterium sp. ESL0764]WEV65010.1 amidohydrolase family protein [Bifidobacterium sp. ESL0764]